MQLDSKKIKDVLLMLIRYGISGFSGIGANLVVFSLFLAYTNLWLWVISVFGFIAAYIVTFLMHKYWTFKNLSKELFYKQSVVYLFSAIVTLLINTSILYILVSFTAVHTVFAQFLSLLFAAMLSLLFTTQVTFHANQSRIHMLTNFFNVGAGSFMRKHRVWLVALMCIMSVCVLLRVTLFPLTFTSDAESYVATTQLLFQGKDAMVYGERILKPLAPAVVAGISLFGVNNESALLIQAIVFYFVLGLVVFWFGFELFRKQSYAFVLSLIVVTSYPIFRYGVNYYTETGIWVLYFATLAGMMRWTIRPTFKLLSLISILLLLGLLWKEYAVLTGMIFGLAILFQNQFSWTQKTHALLQTAFLVLIPWFLWQYFVFTQYNYSYPNWLAIGSASTAYASEYTLFNFIKTTVALLLFVWPLVIFGIHKRSALSQASKKMLLLMLVPSFGFLLWGYVSSRLFFSLVPLVAPLAVIGFMALPGNRLKIGFVLLLIGINSILVWLAFDPSIRMLLNGSS